jgi:hypothetical protein
MTPPSQPESKVYPPFSDEEFLELSRELEGHHGLFYRLWNLGKPVFSDKIPTAGVYFDRVGACVNFLLNYDFWQTQTLEQKLFVICHECLHVALNHGIRMQNNKDPMLTNQALDIVVNHSLVERFLFERDKVDPQNIYCWVDTVFSPDSQIATDKSFEHYYNLLEAQKKAQMGTGEAGESQPGGSGQGRHTVDSHDDLSNQDFRELIESLNETLSDSEKESLQPVIERHCEKPSQGALAGREGGSGWTFAKVGKVKKKRKWETIIKRWASKYIRDNVEEQWARTNRRMLFFEGDLVIPTEAEVDGFDEGRIQVWFFQDTSGSCYGFIDRFFKAAMSLPSDRFDVKMHCFDTRVFETTLESKKLYGFGGTSFSCIEAYIQRYIKAHDQPYPKAVFVITDGCGDRVTPEMPSRWHWFLDAYNDTWTRNYIETCIPKTCNRYNLGDFE